jgi:putative ABC transport system permease protein
VSIAQANEAVQVLSPKNNPSGRVSVEPIQQHAAADVRPSLLLLWGAAGCILLVTCVNTASLLLARATVRRKEIAVRLALGARRGRLVRQLLAESVLLAAGGGAVGLPLARAGLAAVTALTGHSLTGWRAVEMGGPAIAFAMGASLVSALVFGLAPAWQALRSDPREGLQDSSRGGSSATQPRLRSALVVAQTAVAVALAMSAGLLLQSYAHMSTLRTGVRPEGLVTAWVRIPDSRYGAPESRVKFYDELLGRLRNLPGVSAVGAVSFLQLVSGGETAMAWPEGTPVDDTMSPGIRNRVVSPGYFRVLGIPVLAGREFAETDGASSPKVMLVNESFVRRYFPDGHAVGRHVTYSTLHVTGEIAGIVADVRPAMTEAAPRPEMFFPYMQRPRHQMSLVLRSHLALGALERTIRGELARIDPEQPLYNVRTMEEVMSGVLSRPRSTASIVGFFSAAALLLAAIGIYGVLAFSVAQRSREIGIRLALGAPARQIGALVVGQSMKLIAAGIAIGVPLALALARFFSTMLFGIAPADPATMAAVALLVVVVGWTAAYLPARQATRVDPARALRSQ